MGLKEREYMRRKFFDEEHPWVETSPSSPKTTAESASGTQQRAKGGRFTVEVTHEEYVRIYGKEPFADTNIIKVEVSRTEYERIYRNNPVLASQRRWQGKSSQRSKGKWTKLRTIIFTLVIVCLVVIGAMIYFHLLF